MTLPWRGLFFFALRRLRVPRDCHLNQNRRENFSPRLSSSPRVPSIFFFLFFSFNYPPFRVYFCSQCSIKKVLFGRNLLGMDLSSSLFFHFCGVCVRYVIALSIKTESIISHRGFPFPEGLSLFFSFSLMFSLFHCLLSFFRFNFVEAFIMSITVLLFF